ncbi:MAG TPA: 50S ribosomal protein L25/general stress protein Ctc [Burkholderiales bacterium]|nr:50S ribosomal protein L25/general stress protein Ctc [Burkholderiales bacterium]
MEFTAFPRKVQGTGASRRLRHGGKVPGIVYGANQSAQQIELDHQALYRHLKIEAFHASILEMTLDGARQQVLLRDVQMHPFRQQVLHVDFQRIDKTRKIHMKVPLHFINGDTAPGVKLGGGVANHITNEVEIQCLPDDLPEFIEVDLGKLELGQSVHVNDIALPQGVELISRLKKENPAVAIVQLPKVIAVEEEVAAPVTEITGQAPAEAEAAAAEGGEKKEGEKKEAGKKE